MLAETFTDGFLVVRDGVGRDRALPRRHARDGHPPPDVVLEVAHVDPLRRARRARRCSAPGDLVTDHLPELAGRRLGRVPPPGHPRHARRQRLGLRRRRVHDPRRLGLPHARPRRARSRATPRRWIRTIGRGPYAHGERAVPLLLARHRRARLGARARRAARPSPSSSRARCGRGSAPSGTPRSCSTAPASRSWRAASARRCATSRASG